MKAVEAASRRFRTLPRLTCDAIARESVDISQWVKDARFELLRMGIPGSEAVARIWWKLEPQLRLSLPTPPSGMSPDEFTDTIEQYRQILVQGLPSLKPTQQQTRQQLPRNVSPRAIPSSIQVSAVECGSVSPRTSPQHWKRGQHNLKVLPQRKASGRPSAKPSQCTQCMRRFESRNKLFVHLKDHQATSHQVPQPKASARPSQCSQCMRAFDSRNKLFEHLKEHAERKRRAPPHPAPRTAKLSDCRRCGSHFASRNKLFQHLREKHVKSEAPRSTPAQVQLKSTHTPPSSPQRRVPASPQGQVLASPQVPHTAPQTINIQLVLDKQHNQKDLIQRLRRVLQGVTSYNGISFSQGNGKDKDTWQDTGPDTGQVRMVSCVA